MKMNLFYELPSLDFLGQLCKNLREGVLFGRSLLRKSQMRRGLGKKWRGNLQIAVEQIVMNGAALVLPKESS